jgi:hypothetical protein
MITSAPPASRILGTGHYLPPIVRTNADLEKMVDTSDQWIMERTGIRERRIAPEGIVTSDMATEAAKKALEAAELKPTDLDLIIIGTVTPDMPMPATSVFVQQKLGAGSCPAFDLSAACAGFIFGMSIADQFIRSGVMKNVLVVGVELLSRVINWEDRTTCVLFGDGAGAVVLGPAAGATCDGKPRGLLSTKVQSDGLLAHDPRRRLGRADDGGAPRAEEEQGPHAWPGHLQGRREEPLLGNERGARHDRHDRRRGRLDLSAPGEPPHHRLRCDAPRRPEGEGPHQHRSRRQHVERVDPDLARREPPLREDPGG